MKWFVPIVICLNFYSAQVAAALISTNDTRFGVGSITTDTNNGLEWLDLTESTSLSVNQVTASLGAGRKFETFRYATSIEVLNLFAMAGIPDVGSESSANIAPAQALMDLIGSTSFQGGIGDGREAFGVVGDGTRYTLDGFTSNGVPMMFVGSLGSQGLNASFTSFGHWLVRDTAVVPLPASIGLIVLGLALLNWRRIHC